MTNNRGFTLVELLVATTIALLLMIAIYASYTVQRRSQTAQARITAMQQNIRASLLWMEKESRMAGYKTNKNIFDKSCNAEGKGADVAPSIHTATATSFGFSMDLDDDGKCSTTGENVTYTLFVAADNIQKLSRKAPDTNEAVSENIEAIEFMYSLKDGTKTIAPTLTQIDQITAVQISLLARSDQRDPGFDNSTIQYATASGANWGPYNDHIHRSLIISNISFRNIGI